MIALAITAAVSILAAVLTVWAREGYMRRRTARAAARARNEPIPMRTGDHNGR